MDQRERSVTEMAEELMLKCRLSPPEVKETKNFIRCIRAGMWQFSQSYGNLDGKTAFEQLNQAVAKLGEGRADGQLARLR